MAETTTLEPQSARKMSHWSRGPRAAEIGAKIVLANTGRKHSPEARANMSLSHLGKSNGPRSVETRRKISISNTGKKRTVAMNKAASERGLGRHLSAEAREKVGAASRGKKRPPFTPEWRAAISRAHKGRKPTPEAIAARSEGLKRCWAEGRHAINKSYRYTSLAQQLHRCLAAFGIQVEPEVRFGRFSVDLYDREHHIAYEADGRYWHNRNEAKYPGYHIERDCYLLNKFDLPVMRFDELQIADMARKLAVNG